MTKKKLAVKIVAITWVVFTTAYFFVSGAYGFYMQRLGNAYADGKNQTIETIVKAASQCKPVNLTTDDGAVKLADLGCLQKEVASNE